MAEIGRQPFIVYGLLKVKDAVSPNLTPGDVWFSLLTLGLVYAVLIVIEVMRMLKYAKKVPDVEDSDVQAQPAA